MGKTYSPDGQITAWNAVKNDEAESTLEVSEIQSYDESELSPITFPNSAYGFEELPEAEFAHLKGATVWTNGSAGIIENGDVIVKDGKILAVGNELQTPQGAKVISAFGKHITAGIIDEHSHIAIERGVNEGSHPVTAEVSIGDVIRADDIAIYRELAGGVTSAQLLHGSANPIGGQSGIIKLRWGQSAEKMKISDAKGFIKFALGENVKQSNWGDAYSSRFPQTRIGVEQFFQGMFDAARAYRKEKEKSALSSTPFRKDIQLETLLEILDSKRFVTCHSYVQSEILMLMRLAERNGFKLNTFTHVLEGYKIASELASHGANASTFSDWWAYKYEVIDAIPYNAALMHEAGVNVMLNSDSDELGRRLNQEAAKVVKYGGVSKEEAFKMVSLNAAKALHIDHRVGSIEVGKDADIVVWSGDPLASSSIAEKTFIDGKRYFDRERDKQLRENLKREKERLISMILQTGAETKVGVYEDPNPRYHCDTLDGLARMGHGGHHE